MQYNISILKRKQMIHYVHMLIPHNIELERINVILIPPFTYNVTEVINC